MPCTHGFAANLGLVSTRAVISGNTFLYHVSTDRFAEGHEFVRAEYAARPHWTFFCEPPPRTEEVDENYPSYRLTEQVFERVRLQVVPHAPSRRTAFFVFPCLDCAEGFRKKSRATATTYVVNVSPTTTVLAADMRLRDAAAILARSTAAEREARGFTALPEETVAQLAQAYWVGRQAQHFGGNAQVPEILVDGDIVVARKAKP